MPMAMPPSAFPALSSASRAAASRAPRRRGAATSTEAFQNAMIESPMNLSILPVALDDLGAERRTAC